MDQILWGKPEPLFIRDTRPTLGAGAYPTGLGGLRVRRCSHIAAALPPDLYQRLIDRLRHAEQYAQAARGMAEGALAAFRSDAEVVAMTATLAPDLDERLAHRLRHAEQYAEAARRMAEEALDLLEAAKAAEASTDGA